MSPPLARISPFSALRDVSGRFFDYDMPTRQNFLGTPYRDPPQSLIQNILPKENLKSSSKEVSKLWNQLLKKGNWLFTLIYH